MADDAKTTGILLEKATLFSARSSALPQLGSAAHHRFRGQRMRMNHLH